MEGLRKKEEQSVLWQHSKGEHQEREIKYKMKVERVFGHDATLRQVKESLDIKGVRNPMNRKGEWGASYLPSVAVTME